METSVMSWLVGRIQARGVDRLPHRQADEVDGHHRQREHRHQVLALEPLGRIEARGLHGMHGVQQLFGRVAGPGGTARSVRRPARGYRLLEGRDEARRNARVWARCSHERVRSLASVQLAQFGHARCSSRLRRPQKRTCRVGDDREIRRMLRSEFLDLNHTSKLMI